jgi:hypothetical protein
VRLAPEPQVLPLGESDEYIGYKSLWNGGLYSTHVNLGFPDAAVFEIWYNTYLSIRDQTPWGENKTMLDMRFSMLRFQSEKEKELKFKSVCMCVREG